MATGHHGHLPITYCTSKVAPRCSRDTLTAGSTVEDSALRQLRGGSKIAWRARGHETIGDECWPRTWWIDFQSSAAS